MSDTLPVRNMTAPTSVKCRKSLPRQGFADRSIVVNRIVRSNNPAWSDFIAVPTVGYRRPSTGTISRRLRTVDPTQCIMIRSSLETVVERSGGMHALANSFYSILFTRYPESRQYFPATMDMQRERIIRAVLRIVDGLAQPDTVTPFLGQLGRDHRKYGLEPAQFRNLAVALAAAVEQASGDEWTPALDRAWTEAVEMISTTMTRAAESADGPPAWVGTVVDRRNPIDDVAVVTLRLDQPMPYRPGQYVSVQVPGRPRMWRYLSPAIPPNPELLVEFHVRRVSDGWVSPSIVSHTQVGETWVLGSPMGALGRPADPLRPTLMVASGTGIAPIRAQLLALDDSAAHPSVYLYYSGRHPGDLYDLGTLLRLRETMPWLTVVPVVRSAEVPRWFLGAVIPGIDVVEGDVSEIVASQGNWAGYDVQVAGPPEMISTTRRRLHALGVPAADIRHDPHN